ncbi:hypothetical protein AMATHDRAFT_6935 [Amanita thiersii Skay4041]|uniref:Uncharacterized protein n=1 Tax=Amanita thiersii Skay4041 TaxID=703135 RepID=A0A2A9N9K7_9AGAR|nr:hypothetical protein AMATHDRAFT_6935 [Amanita thiersii Skay4041]
MGSLRAGGNHAQFIASSRGIKRAQSFYVFVQCWTLLYHLTKCALAMRSSSIVVSVAFLLAASGSATSLWQKPGDFAELPGDFAELPSFSDRVRARSRGTKMTFEQWSARYPATKMRKYKRRDPPVSKPLDERLAPNTRVVTGLPQLPIVIVSPPDRFSPATQPRAP